MVSRIGLGLQLALGASLAMGASPASAQDSCTPGTTHKIAFMLKQQTAFRYLNADVPFFKKTAEAAGYEVIVQSAENDAQNQISQAENVITQGVDAIVIQPVDFNVAAGIAELAAKAGIPLASYDDLILGALQAGYIGRDPKDGGAAAAKAVVAKVPKGNYVLIGGDAGQTGSTLMQEGYHTVLDPLVASGDIKIVMDQFTPAWKTEPAQANAENALTANDNKVDAFLVSYDGMSLGVLQAIDAAGIAPGSILVTGSGHGIVGGAGDRRRPAVRQPLAGTRRDGSRRRECRRRHGAVQGHRGHHDRRQRRRPDPLGQDADLPRQPDRDGGFRLQASTLAEHRRGLQERARQEAGLPVASAD